MVHYFYNYSVDNNIYSCDMMRFKLSFMQDMIHEVTLRFSSYDRLDVDIYPINFSSFKYRQLLTVKYALSSMTIGIGFNGTDKESIFDGFIEFNPNKCFYSELCMEDIKFIMSCCWNIELVRWDLAIDIPCSRYLCHLCKDKRTFSCIRNSVDDFTEYLGQNSRVGRVKLYNKTFESSLNYDLTRLEITLPEIFSKDFDNFFPTVLVDNFQNDFVFNEALNDTDKVLVELLRNCDNADYYLSRLGRVKREKLKKHVYNNSVKIEFDKLIIYRLYNDYKMLLGF